MKSYIWILQIIVSVLLIVIILLQARGSGLGTVFGGSGGSFRSKRGAEKLLHLLTIILSLTFVVVSIISVLVS